jgi:hypothetical protein
MSRTYLLISTALAFLFHPMRLGFNARGLAQRSLPVLLPLFFLDLGARCPCRTAPKFRTKASVWVNIAGFGRSASMSTRVSDESDI